VEIEGNEFGVCT